MKFSIKFLGILAITAFAVCSAKSQADEVVISDFNNFNLTGTYEQWNDGTFTSNPTDFRVQANDFGGGFFVFGTSLDGGPDGPLRALRLDFTVNSANVSDAMNVVLFDADGTERVFRFDNLTAGPQVRTILLTDFLQDNNAGGTPGLDISNITQFHLQGTFANGNPGLLMDQTFNQLSLVTIPEPGSLIVFGATGLAILLRRSRKN